MLATKQTNQFKQCVYNHWNKFICVTLLTGWSCSIYFFGKVEETWNLFIYYSGYNRHLLLLLNDRRICIKGANSIRPRTERQGQTGLRVESGADQVTDINIFYKHFINFWPSVRSAFTLGWLPEIKNFHTQCW